MSECTTVIEIHTPLAYTVTAALVLWLAISILAVLGIQRFSSRLARFGMVQSWSLFTRPVRYHHTLEYLDESEPQAHWIVAASTQCHPAVPFAMGPTALLAYHLHRVSKKLEAAVSRPEDPARAATVDRIAAHLQRHPAIRALEHRPAGLRVVRRCLRPEAAEVVLRSWVPFLND